MDCSSSRLENEGEVQSVYNDNDLTDEDDPEIEMDDKEDNTVLYEVVDEDDKIEEPKASLMFDSTDEVLRYYVKYAKQDGFVVIKRDVKNIEDA